MTLKIDAKFAEKLTAGSKHLMRNLVNFNASSGKSQNLHFDVVSRLSIAYKVSLITLKKDPNFEKKLIFCLKNEMMNLVNFNANGGKPGNLHFVGLR